MNKRTYLITPSSEECRRCKAYCPEIGCMEISCIQLKAAVSDGTVTYRDLLMTIYPQPPTFAWMLQELAGTYLGYLWVDEEHRQRYIHLVSQMGDSMTVKRRSARRYVAAIFLFTSNLDFYKRTYKCVTPDGIDFTNAYTEKMSREHSFLLHAARCLYESRDEQLILNIGYSRAVYAQNLRTIVNAILLAKYGTVAFVLKGDGGC